MNIENIYNNIGTKMLLRALAHAPLVWLASFRGASGLRQCEVACGLENGVSLHVQNSNGR